MSKTLETRIQNKMDFEVNWQEVETKFIPYEGELIVYASETDSDGVMLEGVSLPEGRTEAIDYTRIKIGDGVNYLVNLPFVTCPQIEVPEEPDVTLIPVQKPYLTTDTFIYNRSEHTITWTNYQEDKMSIKTEDSVTYATNAGTYTIIVSLIDPNTYCWEDGTTSDLSFTWTIDKASSPISLKSEDATITLNSSDSGAKYYVQLVTDQDVITEETLDMFCNSMSAVSANTNIASVGAFSYFVLPISYVGEGSTTITITAAELDNYYGKTMTIKVACTTHTHSWITIQEDTCTEIGQRQCSTCGETEEYNTLDGHDYYTQTAATCGTPGVRVCRNNSTHTEIIPATGNHTEVTIPAVEATCTTTGNTEGKRCSVCNTVIKQPQTIPLSAHIEGTQWYANSTEHSKHCTVCNNRIQSTVGTHEWDSWGNDTTGENHKRTCQVCNKSVTEPHTKNHDYYAQESATTHEWHWDCPVCGIDGHTSESHTFVNGVCSKCDYVK